ncbi:hypothetical protein XI08_09630 [Bradyrhizobium sp. CCBAU 11361]|nr:hypothetical protein [Bradyrhizobium sp. CCBAU 11361]
MLGFQGPRPSAWWPGEREDMTQRGWVRPSERIATLVMRGTGITRLMRNEAAWIVVPAIALVLLLAAILLLLGG